MVFTNYGEGFSASKIQTLRLSFLIQNSIGACARDTFLWMSNLDNHVGKLLMLYSNGHLSALSSSVFLQSTLSLRFCLDRYLLMSPHCYAYMGQVLFSTHIHIHEKCMVCEQRGTCFNCQGL